METADEMFTKRYHNKEPTYNSYIKRDVKIYSQPPPNSYHTVQPYFDHQQRNFDEPIDLTQNPGGRLIKTENSDNQVPCPEIHVNSKPQYAFKPRGRRTTKVVQREQNILDGTQLQALFTDAMELQTTETKHAEILKAAKTLFSKRTRTLYHWMYPNTPKAQIKLAVANSWDNLGTQEKQFYISQVLVRFGYPQSNLMVNPQLGGIKELPPLPETFVPAESSSSAKELQTAISSISGESSGGGSAETPGKRKQGRPLGSKNKKKRCMRSVQTAQSHGEQMVTYRVAKDFQDDPELSKELEKFAISFDWLK